MKPIRTKRHEWIQETKARLDELDRSLAGLELRATEARHDITHEIEGRLNAARKSLDAALARWNILKDGAEEVWETVSEEIALAWETNRSTLEASLDELRLAVELATSDHDQASEGDTVQVRFAGAFEDGTPLGRGEQARIFTVGEDPPLPGFDEAVRGLHVGEGASVTIPAEEMYGKRKDDLIMRVPAKLFPSHAPKLGDRFEIRPPDGGAIPVTVRRVVDGVVEVDANHPLAGSDLHVELELVSVVPNEQWNS